MLNDPGGGSFRFDAGAVFLDFAHPGGPIYWQRVHDTPPNPTDDTASEPA
jgi:hypothetical protein